MKNIDSRQLSLFDMEERAAIFEHDAGMTKHVAEKKAGLAYHGPLPYLLELVKESYPLIHLCGGNPHISLVRSFASDEPEIAKRCSWVERVPAIEILKANGYSCTRHLHTTLEQGPMIAEIWHKPYIMKKNNREGQG